MLILLELLLVLLVIFVMLLEGTIRYILGDLDLDGIAEFKMN
jgi:hypothetical protein